MRLLPTQKKNWEEKGPSAGEKYRKDNLVLLKNTDSGKSYTHNSLNFYCFFSLITMTLKEILWKRPLRNMNNL